MPGAWLIGAAAGLALIVWDQARLRRFARRAAIAPPDRLAVLARRRLAESIGAGAALAAVALVAPPANGSFGGSGSGLLGFGFLLVACAGAWAVAAWALTRRYTPGLRGRSHKERP